MKSIGWLAGMASAFGVLTGAASASAADLAQKPEAPPVISTDDFQPFFVKLGFSYVLNTSRSNLWSQSPAALARGVFTAFPAGVGASIGDVPTLGVEAGWYITRNVSLNVSGGIPYYTKIKTIGYNPANPAVPDGTVLADIVPAYVPITAVYHFNGFGAFQPYLGAGVAPGFSFGNRNAFLTGVHVGNSVGLVLQGGADYMVTKNWGVSLDVKKTFAYVESSATGMNVPGVGWFPARTYQHTHFQPWAFSAGLVYKFGSGSPLF